MQGLLLSDIRLHHEIRSCFLILILILILYRKLFSVCSSFLSPDLYFTCVFYLLLDS